jgi:hypothetical protein
MTSFRRVMSKMVLRRVRYAEYQSERSPHPNRRARS